MRRYIIKCGGDRIMDFMGNILPQTLDRWAIENGSLSKEGVLTLHVGGHATCALTTDDILYIPKAFQVRARHNANVSWKDPSLFATLDIFYEDSKFIQTLLPFNAIRREGLEYYTENVAVVTSKKFDKFSFSITNTIDKDLTLTLFELRPSLDMDDSLYNSIESMLPQLVYAYNDFPITTPVNIETQVVQLPVSVNADTNLLLHLSITGQSDAGKLTCVVKLDGSTLKSFPINQTVVTGDFYFGVPSLVTFVKKGIHVVTAHLVSADGPIVIPKESALLVLDGKGILGGASGEYPHAEAIQEILMHSFSTKLLQDVDIREIPILHQAHEVTIPMSINNLRIEAILEIVKRGDKVSFKDLEGAWPEITPQKELYNITIQGMSSKTSKTYHYEKVLTQEGTLCITHVPIQDDFSPVYSYDIKKGGL